jgi:hypothetical protein
MANVMTAGQGKVYTATLGIDDILMQETQMRLEGK